MQSSDSSIRRAEGSARRNSAGRVFLCGLIILTGIVLIAGISSVLSPRKQADDRTPLAGTDGASETSGLPDTRTEDLRMDAASATRGLEDALGHLDIPLKTNCESGDACSRYFWDDIESWERFKLSPEGFSALRDALLAAGGPRKHDRLLVETGNVTFRTSGGSAPRWWPSPVAADAEKIRISVLEGKPEVVTRQWWFGLDHDSHWVYLHVH